MNALFRDRETGAFPLSMLDVRARVSVLFGDEPSDAILDVAGVDRVETIDRPDHDDETQTVREGEPVQFGGVWRQTWIVEPIPPAPVPGEVTRRQAKIVLSRAGLLSKADVAIAAMEGQPGEEARIDWADASTFRRDNPLIAGMASALGLSDDQVDTLFRQAAQIP